ncbi:unnamed protein product [Caenorhabditis bovis]|nr:unnamed protein product [Caenorhabditis bovis]
MRAWEELADRVNSEPISAAIAIDLLAHKIISPDQDEAYAAFETIDYLVRNCGEKIHEKVGKHRFLNNLVKVTTPRYLGSKTSPEVQAIAIKLLYTWQKTIRHITNFKDVYESLNENGVVTEDPIIPEEEIIVVPPPAPKRSLFSDKKNQICFKHYLKAKIWKICNLQMISLKYLFMKNIAHAKKLYAEFDRLRIDISAQHVGIGEYDPNTSKRLTSVAEQLQDLRSVLCVGVADLTESNDPMLPELISLIEKLNDDIPHEDELQKNQNRLNNKEKKSASLDQEELLLLNSPNEEEAKSDSTVDGSLLSKMIASDAFVEDVPFIGYDKYFHAAAEKKTLDKFEKSIFETNYLLDSRIPLTKSTSTDASKKNAMGVTRADLAIFEPKECILANKLPIVVLDRDGIRILLYAFEKEPNSAESKFIASIQNYSINFFTDVSLTFNTTMPNTTVQFQNIKKALPGYNTTRNNEPIDVFLSISTLQDVKQIDLDYCLTYNYATEHSVRGNVYVPLS